MSPVPVTLDLAELDRRLAALVRKAAALHPVAFERLMAEYAGLLTWLHEQRERAAS